MENTTFFSIEHTDKLLISSMYKGINSYKYPIIPKLLYSICIIRGYPTSASVLNRPPIPIQSSTDSGWYPSTFCESIRIIVRIDRNTCFKSLNPIKQPLISNQLIDKGEENVS